MKKVQEIEEIACDHGVTRCESPSEYWWRRSSCTTWVHTWFASMVCLPQLLAKQTKQTVCASTSKEIERIRLAWKRDASSPLIKAGNSSELNLSWGFNLLRSMAHQGQGLPSHAKGGPFLGFFRTPNNTQYTACDVTLVLKILSYCMIKRELLIRSRSLRWWSHRYVKRSHDLSKFGFSSHRTHEGEQGIGYSPAHMLVISCAGWPTRGVMRLVSRTSVHTTSKGGKGGGPQADCLADGSGLAAPPPPHYSLIFNTTYIQK